MTPQELLALAENTNEFTQGEPYATDEFEDFWIDVAVYLAAAANHAPTIARRLVELENTVRTYIDVRNNHPQVAGEMFNALKKAVNYDT